jgi:glycosyltransferase involved in cell wall biosynthesis
MHILVVHNYYKVRGGEDAVFEGESLLLQQRGHSVTKLVASNKELTSRFRVMAVALGVIFSVPWYFRMRRTLALLKPDVVHVHNFFPQFSPSIFYACRSLGIPVVLTLHNYRIICPTATLYYGGQVTEESITSGPWWAVSKRVFQNSLMGTFVLALMISLHRWLGTWHKMVDSVIVLTEFAKAKFIAAGISSSRLVVKPNFSDFEMASSGPPLVKTWPACHLAFVGRFTAEKGSDVLLAAAELCRWREGERLVIAAEVPTGLDHLQRANVKFLGWVDRPTVRRTIADSIAVIVPSLWYEGFPMVVAEACALGVPVIASRIGALEELVEHGVTGLLFDPGNASDLAEKMQWALSHPMEMREMGGKARARYENEYSGDAVYRSLIGIYSAVVKR